MSQRHEVRDVPKTASFNIGQAYGHAPGTNFTNRGAVGSVTGTLQAASLQLIGHWYTFTGYAAQSFLFAAAAANTLVTPGDATADNAGFQVAGKKVGRRMLAYCDGVYWYVVPITSDGFCIDGTEQFPSGQTIVGATLTSPTINAPEVTDAFNTYAGDGAITVASQVAFLTKAGSAGAYTVAAPGAGGIGKVLKLTTGSDFAHVVTFTGGTLWDGTAGANTTWTAAAVQGSSLVVVGVTATKWNVLGFNLGTIAP